MMEPFWLTAATPKKNNSKSKEFIVLLLLRILTKHLQFNLGLQSIQLQWQGFRNLHTSSSMLQRQRHRKNSIVILTFTAAAQIRYHVNNEQYRGQNSA